MDTHQSGDGIMTERECWGQLAGTSLGRLVTSVDGWPDVFPVNFAIHDRSIIVRTAGGTKLANLGFNACVAFEADDHDVGEGWSVVVKGYAHVLSRREDVADAERAQVMSWITTTKPIFVRIDPVAISGRRYVLGPRGLADPRT